jgi:hypothetical protein
MLAMASSPLGSEKSGHKREIQTSSLYIFILKYFNQQKHACKISWSGIGCIFAAYTANLRLI